ncbi:hypothetical protein M9435_005310 [Picochlorum sp. BPE23]|nr:hypothetical protein M9435_005310 [Picochlorum sp. BPE23]
MEAFRVLSTGDELKEHKMVLQCQTCRTIVGDSNELVCVYTVGTDNHGGSDGDDEEVQYISIACASNVRLESQEMPSSTTKAMQEKKKTNKKRRMSTDRNDDNDDSLAEQQSIIIVCDTCSNHIGRMHRGDNDDASSIVKDTFSFRLDAVDRYFFGSGDLRVIPPSAPDNASAGDHHQDSIEKEEEEDTKNSTEEVDRMKQDLDEVKKTVAKMQEELSLHRKKLAQYDALFSEAAD